MNFRLVIFLGWALLGGLTACKHQEQDVTPGSPTTQSDDPTKDATPVGQPQGSPTTQTIGPDGGTITTPDGAVKLVFPAGALEKPTAISIQPLTNPTPNKIGQAYRFTPEGLQFKKPATLTFQYDPTKVTRNGSDAFGVAFQGEGNAWYDVAGSVADTVKHEISVAMPHFSDWTPYEVVQVGQELEKVRISNVEGNFDGKLKCGESVSLYCDTWTFGKDRRLSVNFGNQTWQLFGDGKLDTSSGGSDATYTAPATIPKDNPVTVTVKTSVSGRREQVIVFQRIYIVGDDYFRGTIDGVPFDWNVTAYTGIADRVLLIGGEAGWVPNIQISIYHGPDNLQGTYAYSEIVRENRAIIGYRNTAAVGDGSINYYYECTGDLVLSPGGVTISKVERKDGKEIIEGSFTANVYKTSGKCPDILQKKTGLTGSFHLTRTITK